MSYYSHSGITFIGGGQSSISNVTGADSDVNINIATLSMVLKLLHPNDYTDMKDTQFPNIDKQGTFTLSGRYTLVDNSIISYNIEGRVDNHTVDGVGRFYLTIVNQEYYTDVSEEYVPELKIREDQKINDPLLTRYYLCFVSKHPSLKEGTTNKDTSLDSIGVLVMNKINV